VIADADFSLVNFETLKRQASRPPVEQYERQRNTSDDYQKPNADGE
jgi:hypothetical protein